MGSFFAKNVEDLSSQPGEKMTTNKAVAVLQEISKHLLAPSIVLTEFIKIAGSRMGGDAARTRLRLLGDRGMRTVALEEEEAAVAGGLLLSHQNVPTADAFDSFIRQDWSCRLRRHR